ncbi:MAG TPA: glycerophosphodiester phosphodiesterase family protein, partial [Actinomycetota bacterium]|nr:glycerophosphodiester phosphodiesterase family protein [Actinomycetota bacterium]
MTSRSQAGAALAAAHRSAPLQPRHGIVRLIAHRGSGHEHNDPAAPPENTLAGVEHGFAQGADAVEIDVWRTADGVLVVHHDRTTDRTTDLTGIDVTEATYEQLHRASAGAWKSPAWRDTAIPTLAEVAAGVPSGRALVVEVEQGPQVVDDVLEVLTSARLAADRVVYISKNLDTAAELKRAAREQRVLWIVDTTPRWQIGGWAQGHRRGRDSARHGFDEPADVGWLVDQALRHDLDGLDTMFSYPPELPGHMRDASLTWMVWTVNDPRAIDVCLAD